MRRKLVTVHRDIVYQYQLSKYDNYNVIICYIYGGFIHLLTLFVCLWYISGHQAALDWNQCQYLKKDKHGYVIIYTKKKNVQDEGDSVKISQTQNTLHSLTSAIFFVWQQYLPAMSLMSWVCMDIPSHWPLLYSSYELFKGLFSPEILEIFFVSFCS